MRNFFFLCCKAENCIATYRLRGLSVLQYTAGRKCITIEFVLWLGGLQEENCVAIQKKNCIATEGLGSWAGRWARQQARAGGAGRSRQACRGRG